MSKKQPDLPPPGAVDALLTRIEQLEASNAELKASNAELTEQVAAIAGALNALIVVYGVRRLQPPTDRTGDGEPHESTSRGE